MKLMQSFTYKLIRQHFKNKVVFPLRYPDIHIWDYFEEFHKIIICNIFFNYFVLHKSIFLIKPRTSYVYVNNIVGY